MIKVKTLDTGCLPYIEGYMASQMKNPENEEGIWDFFEESMYVDLLRDMPGQHKTTGLGQTIKEVMANTNGPRKWVEVGAWNGNGTTLCLLDGLRMREEKDGIEILSYEADPFLYKIAKSNLEIHPFYGNLFTLVQARIPSSGVFPKVDDISENDKGEGTHFFLNYERERTIYETAEEVAPPFIPEAVILDGGEYTGRFDWDGLEKSQLQYVFLDDVGIFKHRSIFETLINSSEWVLFRENKYELNGWAIFKKV